MSEIQRPIEVEVTRKENQREVEVYTTGQGYEKFKDGESAIQAYTARDSWQAEIGSGFATTGGILIGIYLASQSIVNSDERVVNALFAGAFFYAAASYGRIFMRDRERRELAPLQAKATEDAKKAGYHGEKSVFPIDPDSRVIAAIQSIQASGGRATLEQIRNEDARLRNPEKAVKPRKISKRSAKRALDRLAEANAIKPWTQVLEMGSKKQPYVIYELPQSSSEMETA